IIDAYSHIITRRVGKILLKEKYYGPGKQMQYPANNADAEIRLAIMEKFGIDVQVLTQTTPVLLGFNAADAAEICRLSNDDNYALCKAYPKKFINVCMLSLLDVKDACKELERCIKDLDCRGVTISSNQNGRGLDFKEFDPFYKIMEKHELPVFIHPTHWEEYPLVDVDKGWKMMQVFGWPFDTTQAIWRMIFGGVFDRFPALQVVSHHLGAMFPYYADRVKMTYEGALKGVCKRHIMDYWKDNLWGDTSLSGSRSAVRCGYDFLGAERMMYATDYPFGPEAGEMFVRECLASVNEMKIPAKEKKMILSGNIKKLLNIK
ncbi:amidohydrolase family protein, partial [Chloroflexota bacterium]